MTKMLLKCYYVFIYMAGFLKLCYCQRANAPGVVSGTAKKYVVYFVQSPFTKNDHETWLCGGALVSPTQILTAAACLVEAENIYAIAGYKKFVDAKDIESDECTRTRKQRVVKILVPTEYKLAYENPAQWINVDVGVAIVEKPYNFSDLSYRVHCSYEPQPIYVNFENKYELASTHAVALGWGNMVPGNQGNTNSQLLQESSTVIVDKTACANTVKTQEIVYIIEKYLLCASDNVNDASKVAKVENDSNKDCTVRRYDLTRATDTNGCFEDDFSFRRNDEKNGTNGEDNKENSQSSRTELLNDTNYTDYLFTSLNTRRSSSSTLGPCQSGHGCPLIRWVGDKEVVIGVSSNANKNDECRGPFLYVSTAATSKIIKCLLETNSMTRKFCNQEISDKRYEVQEIDITWPDYVKNSPPVSMPIIKRSIQDDGPLVHRPTRDIVIEQPQMSHVYDPSFQQSRAQPYDQQPQQVYSRSQNYQQSRSQMEEQPYGMKDIQRNGQTNEQPPKTFGFPREASPGQQFGQPPAQQYKPSPGSQRDPPPGPQYEQQTGSQYEQQPSGPQFDAPSGQQYDSQPAQQFGSSSGQQYESQPGEQYAPQMGQQYEAPPGQQYEPQVGQENESPQGQQYGMQQGQQYEAPAGQQFDSSQGQQYEQQQGQQFEQPLGQQYEPPTGQQNEPQPGQQSESQPGQQYESPVGQLFESLPGEQYESQQGRQEEPPMGQQYDPPPRQPYDPAPGQQYESQPGQPAQQYESPFSQQLKSSLIQSSDPPIRQAFKSALFPTSEPPLGQYQPPQNQQYEQSPRQYEPQLGQQYETSPSQYRAMPTQSPFQTSPRYDPSGGLQFKPQMGQFKKPQLVGLPQQQNSQDHSYQQPYADIYGQQYQSQNKQSQDPSAMQSQKAQPNAQMYDQKPFKPFQPPMEKPLDLMFKQMREATNDSPPKLEAPGREETFDQLYSHLHEPSFDLPHELNVPQYSGPPDDGFEEGGERAPEPNNQQQPGARAATTEQPNIARNDDVRVRPQMPVDYQNDYFFYSYRRNGSSS